MRCLVICCDRVVYDVGYTNSFSVLKIGNLSMESWLVEMLMVPDSL